MKETGCLACHSDDGSRLVGPSFKDIYGALKIVITDGEERTLTVDDEYLKLSITEPDLDLVKGYNKGLMQSYRDELNEEEIDLIIEYLRTFTPD